MHTYMILVLAILILASDGQQSSDATLETVAILTSDGQQSSNTTLKVCWTEAYSRGHGRFPNQCGEGEELDLGLCFQQCKANYTGVGPVCWENCPPGYNDIGALCSIPPSTYYECPWYDVCGLTFAKGCLGPCDDGYEMVACSCYRPGKTIAKKSYERGAGVNPSCSANLTQSGGLCYDFCQDEYFGTGPICWKNESATTNYTVQCSLFAFGYSQADCDNLNQLLKHAGITTPLCLGALVMSISSGHIVGPQYCIDLIKNILPALAKTPVCGSPVS